MMFPFGKAPLWLAMLAGVSGLVLLLTGARDVRRPDLTLTLFHQKHLEAYLPAIARFEQERGVKVQVQLVDVRALPVRIKNAHMSGVGMPDLVELETSSFGFFTRGPLEDMAFLDLTSRLRAEGLDGKLVPSRLEGLTAGGRVFGIPHDVHPVMLAYRKDILAEHGIDPDSLRTWDDFTAAGRRLTRDLDGDGRPDRFALDLPDYGGEWLQLLLLQRGGALFDAGGRPAIRSEEVRETLIWYIRQISGPTRIAFPAGWGQGFYSALQDGVVAFVFAPDWRLPMIEDGAPGLAGELGLMPLPAWTEGGPRTSVHGGSGIHIGRHCPRPDLAWDLVKAIYFDSQAVDRGFELTGIIPAHRDFWALPAMRRANPYFSGDTVGSRYAALAPQTPPQVNSPYGSLAAAKVGEVLFRGKAYYLERGEDGLREFVARGLEEAAASVERVMRRNAFHAPAGSGLDEGSRP